MPVPQKQALRNIEEMLSGEQRQELEEYIKKTEERIRREIRDEYEGLSTDTHLLDIKLNDDNSVSIKTVFDKVRAIDMKDALESLILPFVNEAYSHGRQTGESIRIFLHCMLAGLIAVYPPENAKKALQEFIQTVANLQKSFKRTR